MDVDKQSESKIYKEIKRAKNSQDNVKEEQSSKGHATI